MELATREQSDEGGVDLGSVVTAHKQPVLPADSFAAKLALGAVVVGSAFAERIPQRIVVVALP